MNNTLTQPKLQEYNFCFWLSSNKYKVEKYVIFAESRESAEAMGRQKLIQKGIDFEDVFRINVQSVLRGTNSGFQWQAQRQNICRQMSQATLRAVDSGEIEDWLK